VIRKRADRSSLIDTESARVVWGLRMGTVLLRHLEPCGVCPLGGTRHMHAGNFTSRHFAVCRHASLGVSTLFAPSNSSVITCGSRATS
jgi:hypothetical protein